MEELNEDLINIGSNLKMAHNFSNNINFCLNDWNSESINLFRDEFIEQKSEKWFKKRMIGGSDVGTILGQTKHYKTKDGEYRTRENILKEKIEFFKDPKNFQFQSNDATNHGNKYEDFAGFLYTKYTKSMTMFLGIHQHEEYKFLTVSPDLISNKNGGSLIEIKCPYNRKIIDFDSYPKSNLDILKNYYPKNKNINLKLQSLNYEKIDYYEQITSSKTFELIKESLEKKKLFLYHTITNLSIEEINMMKKVPYYYSQIQFQNHVCKLTNNVDFIQLGIPPNQNYSEPYLPQLLITSIPYDPNWLNENISILSNFWIELTNELSKFNIHL